MLRSTLAAGLLLVSGTALAAATDYGFNYTLTLFLHQALFVFWLGPDIGVYMWSTKLVNTEVTPAQRVAAARIMPVISVISLACMSLMLTVGGILTEIRGIEHEAWQMAAIIALGPFWLGLTLLTFFRSGTEAGEKLAKLDITFRWVVIVSVLASVAYATAIGRLEGLPWLTAKLLLFAALVYFGIMVRNRLAPIAAAADSIEANGPTPEVDATLTKAVGGARVFVFASWLALAMAAGLGTFQPGSAANPMSLENRLQQLPD